MQLTVPKSIYLEKSMYAGNMLIVTPVARKAHATGIAFCEVVWMRSLRCFATSRAHVSIAPFVSMCLFCSSITGMSQVSHAPRADSFAHMSREFAMPQDMTVTHTTRSREAASVHAVFRNAAGELSCFIDRILLFKSRLARAPLKFDDDWRLRHRSWNVRSAL